MPLKCIDVRVTVKVWAENVPLTDKGDPQKWAKPEFEHTLGYQEWTPEIQTEYKALIDSIRAYMGVKLKNHIAELAAAGKKRK